MGSKRRTAGGVTKEAAPQSGDARKRKAATAATDRQVRRKIVIHKLEKLESVHHPSHGKVAGEVFVFGDGDCGQLGFGEEVTERLRPYPVSVEGKRILQIACGGMHTVVLAEDHTLFSWGVNDEGALGRPTPGDVWKEAAAGLNEPLGDSYIPGQVQFEDDSNIPSIIQISAGDSHSCALTADGAVWAWGTYRDSSGVMGFSPATRIQLTPVCVYTPSSAGDRVVRIVSGADHTVVLTEAGTVLTWGSGQQGQLGRVGERMSDRVKLETLLRPHTVPLKFGRGKKKSAIVDVNAGTYSTFALAEDGTVFAWGLNNYGQLALPGQAPVFAPTQVHALADRAVKAVRAGQHHTVVVTKEGGLLSFGRPTYGRLGRRDVDVGADTACPEVKAVEGLDGVTVVGAAAGLAASGCISEDGRAWMWGFGTSNQLGKGDDDEDEMVPRLLAETKKFAAQKVVGLEFGGQHVGMLCVPKVE